LEDSRSLEGDDFDEEEWIRQWPEQRYEEIARSTDGMTSFIVFS